MSSQLHVAKSLWRGSVTLFVLFPAIRRTHVHGMLAPMCTSSFLLLDTRFASPNHALQRTLERFGEPALRFAVAHGIRVVPLARGQRYDDASTALRRLNAGIDEWPAPPAGLFVVEERSVYLRSYSAMTVAHEFGHALDCALGDGVYLSGTDPHLRRIFENATQFVTPYASTAIDEYFAEGIRAFVECNDPTSFWPRATRARLRRVDPGMFTYIEYLFANKFQAAA
ncbi:MAG: hypothetical protein NVSMB31_01170 [Vulcanimicrobiaceae bacterium]